MKSDGKAESGGCTTMRLILTKNSCLMAHRPRPSTKGQVPKSSLPVDTASTISTQNPWQRVLPAFAPPALVRPPPCVLSPPNHA